jgi:acetate kinase
MRTLVFSPEPERLSYSYFLRHQSTPTVWGVFKSFESTGPTGIHEALRLIQACPSLSSLPPELIAVRVAFGGELFKCPAVLTDVVLRQLETLASRASPHLPPALVLLRGCTRVFENIPILLVFETAFFSELLSGKRHLILGSGLAGKLGERRHGLHGLFHEAACRHVRQLLAAASNGRAPRILSVCLESQPEIAAVEGEHPVMVISDIAPLDRFPDRTTGKELDPNIRSVLAKQRGQESEEIKQTLTTKNSTCGVTSEQPSLGRLLTTADSRFLPAQQVTRNGILRAAAEANGLMGGLDVIVYSGRFENASESLQTWLLAQTVSTSDTYLRDVTSFRFGDSLEQVIAETAVSAYVSQVTDPIRR